MLTILFGLSFNTSFANDKKYDKKTFEKIYGGIAFFLKVADENWKVTKDEDKALMYSQAAANYKTFYEAFCN